MRPLLALLTLGLALSGCSFRFTGPSQGKITSISVSPWGPGEPAFIRATTSFPGARDDVTLAIEPDATDNTIRVRAYGTVPLPLFGWGVFRSLPDPPRSYDVQGAVYLPRAGTWRVDGMGHNAGEVTASATFTLP